MEKGICSLFSLLSSRKQLSLLNRCWLETTARQSLAVIVIAFHSTMTHPKHTSGALTHSKLPTAVRYVKTGRGGEWWQLSKDNGQIHLGWNTVPDTLILKPDFPKIERILKAQGGAAQDFKALCALLDGPSKCVWITIENGYMWWCTVRDGAIVNPKGESSEGGHFWLVCDRPWSNKSLKGTLLAFADLPGTVDRKSVV